MRTSGRGGSQIDGAPAPVVHRTLTVDVDLVLVDQDLVVGQTLDHLTQRSETPTTLAGRERAKRHRTWCQGTGYQVHP